jgi:hypothetical protein
MEPMKAEVPGLLHEARVQCPAVELWHRRGFLIGLERVPWPPWPAAVTSIQMACWMRWVSALSELINDRHQVVTPSVPSLFRQNQEDKRKTTINNHRVVAR